MGQKIADARIVGKQIRFYDSEARIIAAVSGRNAVEAIARGETVVVRYKSGNVRIFNASGKHLPVCNKEKTVLTTPYDL